jgi:serine/threonine protein kinase
LDIKPENLFISAHEMIKIGDFGLAAAVPIPSSVDREGDRTYIAPEILGWNSVDYSADIFSLGLIVLEMASNLRLPENGPVWHCLREANFDNLLENIPVALTFIIKSMLQPDPTQRPNVNAMLEHPLVSCQVNQPLLLSSSISSNTTLH